MKPFLGWLKSNKKAASFFEQIWGTHYHPWNLRTTEKLAVRYDINPAVVYPHSFRHRFAKNFLERCNDIAFLADLMGHESIETTRIYLRKTATEQREIVDTIVDW